MNEIKVNGVKLLIPDNTTVQEYMDKLFYNLQTSWAAGLDHSDPISVPEHIRNYWRTKWLTVN